VGIWVDDPPGSCAVEVSGDRTTVAADDDAVLSVTVTTDPSCADETGTLVLESDPASDPLSARFSFVKSDSELAYASAPAAAALAALGLAAALFLTKGEAEIDLGAVFSFKDSWLTTVATFTAVLGTILTTTGVIANLLPGLDTDRLLALNLGFGGLVLIAPVVYAALASWGWRDDTDGKRALSALATRPGSRPGVGHHPGRGRRTARHDRDPGVRLDPRRPRAGGACPGPRRDRPDRDPLRLGVDRGCPPWASPGRRVRPRVRNPLVDRLCAPAGTSRAAPGVGRRRRTGRLGLARSAHHQHMCLSSSRPDPSVARLEGTSR
jgi:hypothetical protein